MHFILIFNLVKILHVIMQREPMKWLFYIGILVFLFFGLFAENHKDITLHEGVGYVNLENAKQKFFKLYDTSEVTVKIPNYKNSIVFNAWMRKYLVQKELLKSTDTLVDTLYYTAIKKFQRSRGLNPDGLIGPKTFAALKIPGKVLYQKIIINMQRWRADRQPDSCFILINIPSFTLSVINKNKIDLTFKVIVGKPTWKTPVIFSKVNTVIVNPYWYVPHNIAIRELIFDIKKDRDYLRKNNFKLLNSKNQVVDYRHIDWARVDASNFNYLLRQEPGADNALGVVKFLFPSPYSIYMHDTPAKTLFENEYRALSHGCIRLEKPMELVDYLARNGFLPIGIDSVECLIEKQKNYRVLLKKLMPIYVGYFTCEADFEGNLFFYNDVYKKDEGLVKLLFE